MNLKRIIDSLEKPKSGWTYLFTTDVELHNTVFKQLRKNKSVQSNLQKDFESYISAFEKELKKNDLGLEFEIVKKSLLTRTYKTSPVANYNEAVEWIDYMDVVRKKIRKKRGHSVLQTNFTGDILNFHIAYMGAPDWIEEIARSIREKGKKVISGIFDSSDFESRAREWLNQQDDRAIASICNRYTYTYSSDKAENIELLIDELNYGNPTDEEKERRLNNLKYRFSLKRGYQYAETHFQ